MSHSSTHTHRRPGRAARLVSASVARARTPARHGVGWRLLVPLVCVLAGALFTTSAISSGGTDLRPGQYDDLADLARARGDRLARLQAQEASLSAEVDRLTALLNEASGRGVEERLERLRVHAGLAPMQGPGLTVTLEDAPEEVLASAGDEVSNAIVHQQDIQAVVNALWAGGAEAMTIQGQRVVSTTGIKCVGNTVVLHGVPYSPPYVISAVGDADRMLGAIAGSAYIQAYLQAVEEYRLGWEVEREASLDMPAYDGPTELKFAAPADDGSDRAADAA